MALLIPGFRTTELLYECPRTLIYRAIRLGDDKRVILKVCKADVPENVRTRLRHEFDITSKLNLPNVVKTVSLLEHEGNLIMVMEDIGGKSLDHYVLPLSIKEFLELAIALADAVGAIHKRQIIHKNINPSNSIWNAETKQLNLIDFGIADEIPERTVSPQAPSSIEGTLEFISPEQTGRMNRVVDYRTDFYSLGVTFYQLLTGRLPFVATDALGIVHLQIAGTAQNPYELKSDIPEMISRIVMKLIAKMADERYQSAWGMKADLEQCLKELQSEGTVKIFDLGKEDFSDQLRVPQRLYGREWETKQLLDAFERVCKGERELFLVAGFSGIGKTALVHEVHRSITEKRGYYIEGKFDQLQRNVPYYAWIQAFTGFVNYLLMESESKLAQWKQIISKAVGSIGRVLTNVIPNLHLVIGTQPEIPELESTEAQNRFNYVFLEFIRAITTGDHPLVIFLDDLQWIDAASLSLLRILMSNVSISHILFIGAYRDNEVDSLHPLTKVVEAIRNEKTRIELIKLLDLPEENLNELVADTLQIEYSQTIELMHRIYSKTEGNPFFLLQTLRMLVEKQAISFDAMDRHWKWDISALKRIEITDNSVALMQEKIRKLPAEAQQILMLAACIGYQFSIANLSIIAEQTEDRITEILLLTVREGLLVPLDRMYQFVHDRVRQTAYSLITEVNRKRLHLKIGRLLFEHVPEHEEQLFTVVDHLNIGAELITGKDERLALARLNLRAGLKARSSAAFTVAAKYFEAGIDLLDKENWTTSNNLALELYTRAAEAESIVGDFERTEQLFSAVIDNAREAVDMVGVYESRMYSYVSQGKIDESLDTALEILERLELHLPGYPTAGDIQTATEEAERLYTDKTIESLLNLPEMVDVKKRAIARILSRATSAAYLGRPVLCYLSILKEVSLSIRYGNSTESPYFYATYALFLCGAFKDFDTAYRFGVVAIKLLETTNNVRLRSRTFQIVYAQVWHFKQHLRTTVPFLEEGYQSGLESGDIEFAGYNALWYCVNGFFAGFELRQLEQISAVYYESLKRIRAETSTRSLGPLWQTILNLLGQSDDPCQLVGKGCDQKELLPILEQTHHISALAKFYIDKLVLCYLFEDYQDALKNAELVEENKSGLFGTFLISIAVFYDSLVRIQMYPNKGSDEQARILERVFVNQQEMKQLADSAPMNHLHKFYLVEAERMRLAHEDIQALDYYDKAISLAKENEYLQEEALANELAARFWLDRGKENIAGIYMKNSYNCYKTWGAIRKVIDFEERYPRLLVSEAQTENIGVVSPLPNDRSLETGARILDLDTVMKATHAISSDIEMGKLLGDVLHSVIENAGAQKGALLMERVGKWVVMARGEIDRTEVDISRPISIEEGDIVSLGVVRFVARTKERVLLYNAANQGNFVSDPYIRREITKSLLCAPLLSRGELIGILYLENNLTTNAFTPGGVQFLEMLLSQAATSLENATIYESLKESEEKYRQIVDTANEGIWLLGPDYLTVSVNAQLAEILGYTQDEMAGKPVTAFMFDEDKLDHLQRMEKRRKGIAEHYERRYIRKDGHTVWTLASATPLFDKDHNFKGSFAMLADITESKNAEKKLAVSEERLRLTLEAARIGIFDWDVINDRFVGSATYFTMLGYPPEAGYSDRDKWIARVHPDDRAYVYHKIQSVLQRKTDEYSYQARMRHADGTYRWQYIVGYTIDRDANGNAARILGIRMDITERKLAEKALYESEKKYRSLIQKIQVAVVVHSADTRIITSNIMSQKLLGLTGDQIQGRVAYDSAWHFFREDGTELRFEEYPVNMVIATLKPLRDKIFGVYRSSTNDSIWVLVNADPEFDSQGKLTSVIVTFIDITARKYAENELIKYRKHLEDLVAERTGELEVAKEQAESASRAKSAFLANMSHELRTPLNSILGFARLTKELPDVTSEQRKNLDIITLSGGHLLNLINNVLDMSKIESGRITLETVSIDLSQLIQEMRSVLYINAEERGLSFTVEQSTDLPRRIKVDGGKLRQILINLIGNAIKYTKHGGIILRAKVAERGSAEQVRLRFEVEDTGTGISDEDRKRIFQPFVQLRRQMSIETGTGLGLAISRQYVDLMGGKIDVVSEKGKGSIFFFEIPVKELPLEEKTIAAEHGRAIGLEKGQPRYRLLIAEDQMENRILLRKILEPFDFDIREAANGKETVEIFEQWHPDLIWMDIRMPVMDGLESTHRIRSTDAGLHTKIIAITAQALEEDRIKIMHAGCDDFIRKPYRDTEIFDALSRHLGVRFVYEEKPETLQKEPEIELKPEHLSTLQQELVNELHRAVIGLDPENIQKSIQKIMQYDRKIGKSLQKLADRFDYVRLLQILDEYAKKT